MTALLLADISAFITKGATPTTYGFKWEMTGVPFLRSECVSEAGLDMRQSMFISPEADQAFRRSRVQDGDILMTITGYVGRVIRLAGVGSANINQHIARIRVRDHRFDAGYVYHYLSQRTTREYYETITTGQAYPQISLAQVRGTPIPALALAEQRSIAAALDDTDDLVATLERLIVKRQAIRLGMGQSLLARAQSGQVHPTTVAAIILTSFSGPSPTCDERNIRGNEWGVLKTTCSTWDGGWNASAHKVLPIQFWGSHRLEVHVGDTIITKAGPRHRVGVPAFVSSIGERVIPSGKMICLRPSPTKVVPRFLTIALADRRTQTHLDQRTTGMAESQVNFENRDLLDAPLFLPEVPIQQSIVDALADVDDEIDVLRQRLLKARAIKVGIIQQLLAGRTRLPAAEAAA